MKTAISIPDKLFKQADRLAKHRKLSRSELYSRAIEDYVRRNSPELLESKLKDYAQRVDTSLPPDLQSVVSQTLRRTEW